MSRVPIVCAIVNKERTAEDARRELAEVLERMEAPVKKATAKVELKIGGRTDSSVTKEERMQAWVKSNSNANTRRTYDSSVNSFQKYLAKDNIELSEVKPSDLADYLRHRVEVDGVAASTVAGDRAAIADALKYTPQREMHLDPLVKDTLKVCTTKAPQSQPKQHMSAELLATLVKLHDQRVPKSWVAERNIVMLLVMFAGMLRESEATQLRLEHIQVQLAEEAPAAAAASSSSIEVEECMLIMVVSSKMDQAAKGATVMIAANASDLSMCPVRRLRQYLRMREQAGIKSEFVFCTHEGEAMANSTPCGIVQRQVENANEVALEREGVQEKWGPAKLYGSHSLRRGGVTEARRSGVDMLEIQRHGRWKSAAVWGYVGPTVEQRLGVTRELFGSGHRQAGSAPSTPVKQKLKARDPLTPNRPPWNTFGRLGLASPVLELSPRAQVKTVKNLPTNVKASPSPLKKRKRAASSSDDSGAEDDAREADAAAEVALDQEMESWQDDDQTDPEPPVTRSRRGTKTSGVKVEDTKTRARKEKSKKAK